MTCQLLPVCSWRIIHNRKTCPWSGKLKRLLESISIPGTTECFLTCNANFQPLFVALYLYKLINRSHSMMLKLIIFSPFATCAMANITSHFIDARQHRGWHGIQERPLSQHACASNCRHHWQGLSLVPTGEQGCMWWLPFR